MIMMIYSQQHVSQLPLLVISSIPWLITYYVQFQPINAFLLHTNTNNIYPCQQQRQRNHDIKYNHHHHHRYFRYHHDMSTTNDETTTSSSTSAKSSFSSLIYRSPLLETNEHWDTFLQQMEQKQKQQLNDNKEDIDILWEQIQYEAQRSILIEQQAGSQLYQNILLHSNLLSALCTIVSHEIETELIPATTIKDLFMNLLQNTIIHDIRQDLLAVYYQCKRR